MIEYQLIEIGGQRAAILPEEELLRMARRAKIACRPAPPLPRRDDPRPKVEEWDGRQLARRLADRRRRAGLTQGDLARRAGVRTETVNRIERLKCTPDFKTIRRLMTALHEVERSSGQETNQEP